MSDLNKLTIAAARDGLRRGDFTSADLTGACLSAIEDAGALTVNPLKEQRFMAGWVAMRHLKDIGAAEKHFRAMRAAADGPLSRAKADYWIGRALEAKENVDIRKAITDTIQERSDEGELDESGLTVRDIRVIADTFRENLRALHHRRIAYPPAAPGEALRFGRA